MFRFNPEKELDKIQHGGRNRFIFFSFLLLVIAVVGTSYAFYQVRYSRRIIYTRVKINRKDIELAVKVEGEEGNLDHFPAKEEGYTYSKTECDNEGVTTVDWDSSNWKLNLSTSGPNKCTVYFNAPVKYTITARVVGEGGSVEPSSQTVLEGKDTDYFTVTPTEGTAITDIKCDNGQEVERDDKRFKVTSVSNNSTCTITTVEPQQLNEYLANLEESDITDDNTADHNKRYYGPNDEKLKNYIWFNCDTYSGLTESNASQHCEKWRIIGLMNGVETESNGIQNLVKIIRDEPLPNYYVWDNKSTGKGSSSSSYGSNDWTDSRLMMLLNPGYSSHELNASGATGSLYWDRKDGKCSGATSATHVSDGTKTACNFSTEGLKGDDNGPTKSMIETVKWKLGGLSGTSSAENYYQNATAATWYKYERGTDVYTESKTEWTGKIGLMYPSDYGYATGGGKTYNRQACLNSAIYGWDTGDYKTDCAGNDWFSSKTLWNLTPISSLSTLVSVVYASGRVSLSNAYYAYAVRPSLYLTSNTMIASWEGNGSAEAPYIIVA